METLRTPRNDYQPQLLLTPDRGWLTLNLGDLWRYRELLFFLTWHDIKVRYKQTALGAAWAILQPLLTMIIFSLIFGQLAHLHRRASRTRSLLSPPCCPGSYLPLH